MEKVHRTETEDQNNIEIIIFRCHVDIVVRWTSSIPATSSVHSFLSFPHYVQTASSPLSSSQSFPSTPLLLLLLLPHTVLSVYASLSPNPYCIIPYSPVFCSGSVSWPSHIPVSPSLASPSTRHETLFYPSIPPLPLLAVFSPCCPISNPSLCHPPFLSSLTFSLSLFLCLSLSLSPCPLSPARG